MEQPNIFGERADSDSERPLKRLRTANLPEQLNSVNSAASSAGLVASEREPPALNISLTPNSFAPLSNSGLPNVTSFGHSISGTSNPGAPRPTEQHPSLFSTKPVNAISTCPGTSTVSNNLSANNALALGPFPPGAKTSIFGLPPVELRMEELPLKPDEPTIKQEGKGTAKQEPNKELGLKSTTETIQHETKKDPILAPVESFDDHGDLTLVVGKAETRFLVCSHSLRRVSTAWHDRLYGAFSNPKDREGPNGWVVRLPESGPDAMRIILRVVHSDLSKMPAAVSWGMLSKLTHLCDEHDMLVHPTALQREVQVAHKLGHLVWYKHVLLQLLSLTHKRPSGRLFLASHADVDLYNEPYLQWLGFFKSLEDGRLHILRTVSGRLRAALDKLVDPNTTSCRSYKSHDWQQTCDCAMLGGVHRALNGKDWYSAGAFGWEENVAISVRQLVVNIEGIRAVSVEESRMAKKQGGAHQDCTPWTPFTLDDILQVCSVGCAVPIDTAAFQKQAEKCGLHIQAAAANRPVV